MNILSFQDIIKLETHYGIMLCRSETASGEHFFHYIITNRCKIEQMHHDYTTNKDVDFTSYGRIIHSGWGENPSAEDLEIIEKFKQ